MRSGSRWLVSLALLLGAPPAVADEPPPPRGAMSPAQPEVTLPALEASAPPRWRRIALLGLVAAGFLMLAAGAATRNGPPKAGSSP